MNDLTATAALTALPDTGFSPLDRHFLCAQLCPERLGYALILVGHPSEIYWCHPGFLVVIRTIEGRLEFRELTENEELIAWLNDLDAANQAKRGCGICILADPETTQWFEAVGAGRFVGGVEPTHSPPAKDEVRPALLVPRRRFDPVPAA